METSGSATYVLLIHLFLPEVLLFFSESEFNERESEVPKFRVNSLSIVYHCAIHNLPTLTV